MANKSIFPEYKTSLIKTIKDSGAASKPKSIFDQPKQTVSSPKTEKPTSVGVMTPKLEKTPTQATSGATTYKKDKTASVGAFDNTQYTKLKNKGFFDSVWGAIQKGKEVVTTQTPSQMAQGVKQAVTQEIPQAIGAVGKGITEGIGGAVLATPDKVKNFFSSDTFLFLKSKEELKAYADKLEQEKITETTEKKAKLEKSLFASKDGKLPEEGLGETIMETRFTDLLPFINQVQDVVDNYQLKKATERVKNGNATVLDEYRLLKAQSEAEQDKTFLGAVGDVILQFPAFMGEMYATQFIYAGAVAKMGLKPATSWLGKVGQKSLEALVGGTAQTIPARGISILAQTIENMTPAVGFSKDDTNALKAIIQEGTDEKLGMALVKAGFDQWVEVVSEHTGDAIKELISPVTKPVFSAISKMAIIQTLAKSFPGVTDIYSRMAKLAAKAGWDGILEEMAEEQVGAVMRGILTELGLSDAGWQKPTWKDLAVQFVSFGIPGVMLMATSAAVARQKNPSLAETITTTPEMVVGGRDLLAVSEGGNVTNEQDRLAIQELSTRLDEYQQEVKETVFDIGTARIETVEYPDGMFGYSYDVTTPDSGISADFLHNRIAKSREEAIRFAKEDLIERINIETPDASEQTQAVLEDVLTEVENIKAQLEEPEAMPVERPLITTNQQEMGEPKKLPAITKGSMKLPLSKSGRKRATELTRQIATLKASPEITTSVRTQIQALQEELKALPYDTKGGFTIKQGSKAPESRFQAVASNKVAKKLEKAGVLKKGTVEKYLEGKKDKKVEAIKKPTIKFRKTYSGASDIVKKWDNKKIGNYGTLIRGKNDLGGGIYVTESKEYAKKYGEKITVSNVKDDLNLFDVREKSKMVINEDILSKIKKGFSAVGSYDWYLKQGGEELLATDSPQEILDKIQTVIGADSSLVLEKAGFDGVKGEESFMNGVGGVVYNIFNAKNIQANQPTRPSTPRFAKTPTKVADNLIQEAKKYKSAEEFVKAQGEPVYHGGEKALTPTDFKDAIKSFYADSRGALFTSSDKQVAEMFGRVATELYPQLKNPLIVDAKNNNYYDIPIPKELRKHFYPGMKTTDTDSLVEIAQEMGRDGVIIKNVIEGSGEYDPADARDVVIGLKKGSFLTASQLEELWKQANATPRLAGAKPSKVELEAYVYKNEPKFRKKVTKDEAREVIVNLDNKVTSKFFQNPTLQKEFASYDELWNLSKSPSSGIKEIERTIIQETLNARYKDEKRISIADFRRDVVGQLMPVGLAVYKGDDTFSSSDSGTLYVYYGLTKIGEGKGDSTPETVVVTSPFNYDEHGHFGSLVEEMRYQDGEGWRSDYVDQSDIEIVKIKNFVGKEMYAIVKKEEFEENQNIADRSVVLDVSENKEDLEDVLKKVKEEGIIYDAPLGSLFAHWRAVVDHETQTYRVVEVQSDIFQDNKILKHLSSEFKEQTRLMDEARRAYAFHYATLGRPESDDDSKFATRVREVLNPYIEELKQQSTDEQGNIDSQKFAKLAEAKFIEVDGRFNKARNEAIAMMNEKYPLLRSYQNIWHERLVREIIKYAADNGYKEVWFPTPRTVSQVERYNNDDDDGDDYMPYDILASGGDQLTEGDEIDYGGTTMIVVDADSEEITVAPKEDVQVWNESDIIDDEVRNRWENDIEYELEKIEENFGDIESVEDAQRVFEVRDLMNKVEEAHKTKHKIKRAKTDIERFERLVRLDEIFQEKWRELAPLFKDLATKNKTEISKILKDWKDGVFFDNRDELFKRLEPFYAPIYKKVEEIDQELLADEQIDSQLLTNDGDVVRSWRKNLLQIMFFSGKTLTPSYKKFSDYYANYVDTFGNFTNQIESNKEYLEISRKELETYENSLKTFDEVLTKKEQKQIPAKYLKDLKAYYEATDRSFNNVIPDYGFITDLFNELANKDNWEGKTKEEIVEDYQEEFEDRIREDFDVGEYLRDAYRDAWRDSDNDNWYVLTDGDAENFKQPGEYNPPEVSDVENAEENWNIDNYSGSERTVLEFYARQLLPYVEKIRKDNTEKKFSETGWSWIATSLTEADKQTPTAYRKRKTIQAVSTPQPRFAKVLTRQDFIDYVESRKTKFRLGEVKRKGEDINLKRDVNVTDVYGNKNVILAGEALTPYELTDNKYILKDGFEYVVNKNNFENVVRNSIQAIATEFAPELKEVAEADGGDQFKGLSLDSNENYREILVGLDLATTYYTSPHFVGNPNILFHLRLDDQETDDEKKVLFVEEAQSEWALEVRKAAMGEGDTQGHPLLKNWAKMAAKRILMEAEKAGADVVAWTTGTQQQERYKVSNVANSMEWATGRDGSKTVIIDIKRRSPMTVVADANGLMTEAEDPKWIGQHIRVAIGGNNAKQIYAGRTGEIVGTDMDEGMDWAINFYDHQFKAIMEDISGEKAEEVEINGVKQMSIPMTPALQRKIRGEAPEITPASGVAPTVGAKYRMTDSYRLKDDFASIGIEITDEQEKEIQDLNFRIFGDRDIKLTGQILANGEALGMYRNGMIQILRGEGNLEETFYHEAVHKYLDVFTTKEEYIEILMEAQKKYGGTDLELIEEKLAEDIIQYAKTRQGFFGRLKILIDNFLLNLQNFLGNVDQVELLYNNIMAGQGMAKRAGLPPVLMSFNDQRRPRTAGIAEAINREAVRQGLTQGFTELASYEGMDVEEQITAATEMVNNNLNTVRNIVRGSEPLPEGLKGTTLIIAVEDWIKLNSELPEAADVAYELANSPLATGLSEAAQELRMAAERQSLSPSALMQDIKRERAKKVANYEEKRRTMRKEAKAETRKVLLPKEELSWDKFIDSLIC